MNESSQAPSDWFAPEAWDPSSGWQNGVSTTLPVTPSAPPLAEEEAWRETVVPSERCWYRWSAPWSSSGVWAASEITETLTMYEL